MSSRLMLQCYDLSEVETEETTSNTASAVNVLFMTLPFATGWTEIQDALDVESGFS